MNVNDLEAIFAIYEEEFYRLLLPYVVNDLRNKEVEVNVRTKIKTSHSFIGDEDEYITDTIKKSVSELFWGNELNVRFKNIIDESVEKYFGYLFPIVITPSSTNIQYFKEQTLEKIHKHLSKEGYYVTIFNHVATGDRPTEVIDPKTNQEFTSNYVQQIDKLKANIEEKFNKLRENIKRKRLIKYIDDHMEHLISIQLKSYKQFINLNDIQSLNINNETILQEGYKYYQDKWDEFYSKHKPKPKPKQSTQPPERKARAIGEPTTSEIIDKIVAEENVSTPPKTIDDIKNFTYKYRKGYETINDIYDYYIQKRTEKYNRLHYKLEPFITNKHGYKSKQNAEYTPNYFPLKSNFKTYSLHTIAKRHSYIIDLMFENRKYCYLVAININTKKLWVEPTNIKINHVEDESEQQFEARITHDQKSAKSYLQALQTMMDKGMTAKHLKGDGEKAFTSSAANKFYKQFGIEFICSTNN